MFATRTLRAHPVAGCAGFPNWALQFDHHVVGVVRVELELAVNALGLGSGPVYPRILLLQ